MTQKIRVIFMGTPDFARVILSHLAEDPSFEIVGVFAQPDKPVGRGNKITPSPVALFAKEKGFPLFQPEKIRNPLALQQIQNAEAEFIIVAAYGKILPNEILKAAKSECLNVHASLLPRHRGAAPINYALLCDDAETGVAIMRVVPDLDAGPVFYEQKITIQENDDSESLTQKLAETGAEALLKTLHELGREKKIPQEQDHQLATYAPKLTKEMARINWNVSARKIFNLVRALIPWPVAECFLNDQRLRIYKARPLDQISSASPGTLISIDKEGWTVATKDRNILLTSIQLEGKKRMPAFDLANGLRLKTGIQLT